MMLSECCSAPPWGDMEEMGICGNCHDHCGFYDDEEETTLDQKQGGVFTPEQQATIDRIIWEAENCCHECQQPVARFSDGATLHHKTENGRIDSEADADHEPYLQADRL